MWCLMCWDRYSGSRIKVRIRSQKKGNGPLTVPVPGGDAACIIPWTLYKFYGDEILLAEQYPVMRDWVDYIFRVDEEQCGGSRLWSTGFHFADWLALDNPDKTSCFGGTDNTYVATAFYYHSAMGRPRQPMYWAYARMQELTGSWQKRSKQPFAKNILTAKEI